MNQMETLWQFMQEDLKADKLAQGLKHSSARQSAERARDNYFEQQKQAKVLTEQVAAQTDRKDAIKDAVKNCTEKLAALQEKLTSNPPTELDEIRSLLAEAERYRRSLADYDQELRRMAQQSNETMAKVQKIGAAAAKAKADFEKFKKEMQAEKENDTSGKKEAAEQQRAAANAIAGNVEKPLMDEYLSIKKHILPPMAKLVGGACSGCNTAQPSALLAKINGGSEIVECETCGRLLVKLSD